MNKKWLILAGAGVLAAALLLTLVVPAIAQDATPTPQAPKTGFGWGRGFGFGGPCFGGGSWESYDAAAKALGLTPEQLFAEMHSGKTLDEIATAKGVDLQKVQDAMNATRVEAMKTAIQQGVTDGELTQEQADWLLKGVELGFMPGGRGHGRGFGFGGRGMDRKGGTAPSAAPSATPKTTSYSF